LDKLNFNKSSTLLIKAAHPATRGIPTYQDLAALMNLNQSALRLCAESEFVADGLLGLQEQYDFAFKDENIEMVEGWQVYQYLRDGKCDVAQGDRTDGRISAWDLLTLEDTRRFFPFYNPALVIRQTMLEERPEVAAVLADLFENIGPRLDDMTMSQLNACVDIGVDGIPDSGDEKSIEEAARLFLHNRDLDCLPTKIVIGSSFENRNLWVGKLLKLLLIARGYEVVDRTSLGNAPDAREAIEKGEIDIYCELLSQALVSYHGIPPSGLPKDPERLFALAKNLDAEKGLLWPRHSEQVFYSTLVVSNELYEQGVWSIADLAELINAKDTSVKLCTDPIFYEQLEGIRGIEELYAFKFKEEQIVFTQPQSAYTYPNYEALQEGKCDVAHGRTIDDLELWDVQILQDSEFFFPPYIPGLLLRQEVADEYPELAESLVCLNDYISTDALIDLNRRTWGPDGKPDTGDEESMETVGRPFLCEVGLVSEDCPPDIVLRTDVPGAENASEGPDEPPREEVRREAKATPAQVCQEIVLNGNFEQDKNWKLPTTARPSFYTSDIAHSGERSLHLGIINENDDLAAQSVAKQRLFIPEQVEGASVAKSATLSYWYHPTSFDTAEGDTLGALIYNSDETFVLRKLQGSVSNEQAWVRQDYNMSSFIREEIVLYFYVETDGDGQGSGMYLDQVSLQVCSESK
jgi:glycine betaine/choline ABC-type transport system substrate-binding protein